MGWYCVHIQRSRTYEASNRTFLSMLHAENRIAHVPPVEYPVYGAPANDGDGVCYFFSPQAAEQFKSLVKFWGGIPFEEPRHLKFMKRIV